MFIHLIILHFILSNKQKFHEKVEQALDKIIIPASKALKFLSHFEDPIQRLEGFKRLLKECQKIIKDAMNNYPLIFNRKFFGTLVEADCTYQMN